MKIEKLHLQNFRCYELCEISFEEDLTVLIAANGIGKTSILDAIAAGFGLFYRGFPGVKTNDISPLDLRIKDGEKQEDICTISLLTKREDEYFFWGRMKRKNSAISKSKTLRFQNRASNALKAQLSNNSAGTTSIRDEHSRIMKAYNEDEKFELPVVVYYGTERAIRADVKRRRGFKKAFTRFDALAGALDATSNFRNAMEWFNAMEDLERREKIERSDPNYKDQNLEAVRQAICDLLPPKHSNPRIEIRPVRFVIDQQLENGTKKTLRLSQLSDGYRIIFAVVMDLARRLVEANPIEKGRHPFDVPSIVMIDEIDLHLHPSWQQQILASLLKAFPHTQFIVTTHSPQVLTTTPARSLRKISITQEGVQISSNYQFLSGSRAEYVLEDVIGVESRPQENEMVIKLTRYKDLVSKNRWDSEKAKELRDELNDWGRGHEEELEKIDVDIRVREFRRSKEKETSNPQKK